MSACLPFRQTYANPLIEQLMKLLKLARLRSGDIPVGLPPRCSNATSTRPHRAWTRSSAGALGSICFRLFIVALTGHVSVEDTAVHKEGAPRRLRNDCAGRLAQASSMHASRAGPKSSRFLSPTPEMPRSASRLFGRATAMACSVASENTT